MTINRARVISVVALLLSTGALAATALTPTTAQTAQLAHLPYQIGEWRGRDAEPFDADTVRILAADSYVNRSYTNPLRPPAGLYIAYYGRQKPGVSVHSPLHCLPGTGWEALDVATVPLPAGDARRMIVRRNRDRAVVLYWYAVHGRMLASEAASKAWLLHDSIRLHRSDAALIRIVVPIAGTDGSSDAAERQALAFAHDVLPYLSRLWS
jgi:EpsI family protein